MKGVCEASVHGVLIVLEVSRAQCVQTKPELAAYRQKKILNPVYLLLEGNVCSSEGDALKVISKVKVRIPPRRILFPRSPPPPPLGSR
jgi:hypothetical protein